MSSAPPEHKDGQWTVPLRERAGLGTADAAIYVGLSVATLKKYRLSGIGPRYARVGSRIIYRPADFDAYIAKNVVGGGRR
ncbi:helix-turn-helix domain-containing protein [Brevibacterium renqingii]|uniref:helix-turn-helix domain-containing protein n=1 Tax=Brevibacterium renqingii TaxID=2776916 RepID=UPI001ADF6AAB|nr:helix-turn-helix domain-containing protein [Brevibacterium renqingii]